MGSATHLALWIVLCFLTGYSEPANASPEKARAFVLRAADELQQNEACIKRVESNLSFEHYAQLKEQKRESSILMPTDHEVSALVELHAAYKACDKLEIEAAGKFSPALVNWVVMMLTRRDNLRLKLMTKKANWAEYVVGRWHIVLENAKHLEAIEAQIAEVIEKPLEWQAYEIEQRHVAGQLLQAWSHLQQQILSLSPAGKPTTIITCAYEGHRLRC